MFSKSLITAVIVTIIAALPLYFLPRGSFAASLVIVFLASLAAVLLSSRLPIRLPARKPRRRTSEAVRECGKVKWFNASKGFGFITRDSGDDVFVHFRSIRGEGHRVLKDGQRVEFSVSDGEKGLQADDVATIK